MKTSPLSESNISELLSKFFGCKAEPTGSDDFSFHGVLADPGLKGCPTVGIPLPFAGGSSWVGSPFRQCFKVHTVLPLRNRLGEFVWQIVWESAEL